ncbi:MAG: MBL fold metallo-hydrolase [Gammaproteobacteria bacterium]|nr:MBL fold metallo-hydrolase [Gammaproteobacteria bacterium]
MSTNGLDYPHAEHPPSATTVEVAESVRWLTMPMAGSLTHINLYLLEDYDGWFVLDTGLATQQTRELWFEIFDNHLEGKPIKGVICTHMHPDHVGQAGMITDKFRVPFYMTRAEYYQARSMFSGYSSYSSNWQSQEFYERSGIDTSFFERAGQEWRRRMPSAQEQQNARKKNSEPNYAVFPVGFRRLQEGDVLTIGGHDWLVMIGSGHSPEHACLFCKSLKVLISGDQILPIITSNVSVHATEPEANPLKAWMDSHDRFLDLPEDTFVLPAHNLPFYGVRQRLRALINHHEDRMLAIEEHCTTPQTARALLPVLFKRELDARQMMMALGEAIAHCHLLLHRNRLERKLDDDGVYRYLSIDPDLARRQHPNQHDAPDDLPVMV